MAKDRLASSQIAIFACLAAAVIAKDVLHIIEKPEHLSILDCEDQRKAPQADLSDVATVAAAAALKGIPNHEVSWIGAFGLSRKTRPSGVVAIVHEEYSVFPMPSLCSYPLRFGELSEEFMDQNGVISLTDWNLNLVQISVPDSVSESESERFLHTKIDDLKEALGKDLLVVGIQAPKSAARSRREAAADAESAANETESGSTESPSNDDPRNLFNYTKEGGAALFEIGIWSAILFAVAAYFICLYIMKIDEGNDSIIYKATAAKMGKRD